MIQIVAGSILLSLVHALIPNHWIPLVLISRSERWSQKETLVVSGITAFSHTISTILLGIIIGLIGFKLSSSYQFVTSVIAPLILIFMGLIYFSLDHGHSHHEHLPKESKVSSKSKTTIIITLSTAMFFSPCLEIETYYFTAGTLGWTGILMVSFVYLFVTVGAIIILVVMGYRSMLQLKWHFLEHHEKKVTGGILILLGIISFFIRL